LSPAYATLWNIRYSFVKTEKLKSYKLHNVLNMTCIHNFHKFKNGDGQIIAILRINLHIKSETYRYRTGLIHNIYCNTWTCGWGILTITFKFLMPNNHYYNYTAQDDWFTYIATLIFSLNTKYIQIMIFGIFKYRLIDVSKDNSIRWSKNKYFNNIFEKMMRSYSN